MQETCKRVNRQLPEENGRKPRSGDEEEDSGREERARGWYKSGPRGNPVHGHPWC